MGDYFNGWYFKCQSGHQTFAVIPAVHKEKKETSCSIQVITDLGSWNVCFPCEAYRKTRTGIRIGENCFGREGIRLELRTPELTAEGNISFGELSPIQYDIMGPFRYVPFMECRHSVFSMKHRVDGSLNINGVSYEFQDGAGYWEGDRGRSFPKEYAWTQCLFPGGSIMLSVADIPIGGFHFTGIIGVILWEGKEYRLATYLGAKAERLRDMELIVQQGSLRFQAKLLERSGHPLYAPQLGAMRRRINEHPSCRAYYRFQAEGRTLFAFEADNASFEYEYPG